MMEKISRMDLKFFDSATMGDKVRRTRSSFNGLRNTTWLIFQIISEVINIIATIVIVCTYKWWIGLMTVVLMIPFLVYNKKYTDKRLRMEKEQYSTSRPPHWIPLLRTGSLSSSLRSSISSTGRKIYINFGNKKLMGKS